MKKITLTFFIYMLSMGLFAQTYSTGMVTLNAIGGGNLGMSAQIDVTSDMVTLTLIGPSTGWLGIGFNNTSMADSGDVVIFDGTNLTDRNFVGFGTEPLLDGQQDWTVTSNTVDAGIRTVVGRRVRDTGDADDYVFSATAQSLNLVYARKISDFSIGYHGGGSCGTVMSSFTLGSKEFDLDSFKLYPNPATNNYTSIELPQNINNGIVKIYDTLGRLVMKHEVSTDANLINTSNLKSGSYLFVLRTEYGNATKNMIIN